MRLCPSHPRMFLPESPPGEIWFHRSSQEYAQWEGSVGADDERLPVHSDAAQSDGRRDQDAVGHRMVQKKYSCGTS